MQREPCEHMPTLESIKVAKTHECVECVKLGGTWVHLRTCQICGETHCCDSSPGQHATKHYHSSGHSVVSSAEPGETWMWCYADETYYPYK